MLASLADLWIGIRATLGEVAAEAGPLALVLAAAALAFVLRRRFLSRKALGAYPWIATVLPALIALAALLGVVLTLPVAAGTRETLLQLLGIVVTIALALGSSTFFANAMAGFLLRAVGNFRPGDLIRVEDHFGRVTEVGLFHAEIQTEESNLTTLPNLYLVGRPVMVVRTHGTGTVVSADCSLGYDIHHKSIEPVLRAAAEAAGLEEPYVQIMELGDYAVTYRCAGLLREAKGLLATRARLRAAMLDALHEAGIEIVSPAFMNQRRLDPEAPIRPRLAPASAARDPALADGDPAAEATGGPRDTVVFDKAERAARLTQLRERLATLEEKKETLGAALARCEAPAERRRLEHDIERNKLDRDYLGARIEEDEKRLAERE